MKKNLVILLSMLLMMNCGAFLLKGGSGNGSSWTKLLPFALMGGGSGSPEPVIVLDKNIESLTKGESVDLELKLSTPPPTDVVLKIVSPSISILADGKTATELKFSPSNFGSYQKVKISAPADDKTQTEKITVNIHCEGYPSKMVEIKVNPVLSLSMIAYNVKEFIVEGSSSEMIVKLSGNPQGKEYTVNLSSVNPSQLTISPASITFTKDNYSGVTVSLTALADSNSTSEQVGVNLSGEGLASISSTVQILDSDISPVITPSLPVNLNQASSVTASVILSGNPGLSRSVALVSGNTSLVAISPATVNFDATNWNIPQTIIISAVNTPNWIGTTVTVTAGGSSIKSASLTVNTIDPTVQGIVLTTPSYVIDGQANTMQVKLNKQPTSNVTVNLSSSSSKLSLSPSTLVFTPMNFATPRTINLSSIGDAWLEDAKNITITGSSSGIPNASSNLIFAPIGTYILPNVVNPTIKSGQSDTVTVELSGNPGIPVTVNIVSNSPTLTYSPTSVTFTSANWNIPQSVTRTATILNGDEDSHSVQTDFTHTYLMTMNDISTVINTNTKILLSGDTTVIGGGTSTIYVKLSGNPITSRTVNLSLANALGMTLGSSSITFNSTNYNTLKPVTVTGVANASLQNYTTAITATGTDLVSASSSMTTIDHLSIDYDGSLALSVNENGTATLKVHLLDPPSSPTTFSVQSLNTGAVSVSPVSLIFNSSNYNSYQNITVNGVINATNNNQTVTIRTSSGGINRDWNISFIDKHPIVTSITPTNSSSSNTITITGQDFNSTPSLNTVSFNGANGVVTAGTTTSLTVTIPSGGSTGNVVVSNTFGSGTSPQVYTYTPLSVTSTTPTNGFTAPINQQVTVNFNVNINPTTINSSTFQVSTAGTPISGTITQLSASSFKFVPTTLLNNSSLYTITLTTGVKDLVGKNLSTNFTSNFTTEGQYNIVGMTPSNGATGIPINQIASVTFLANVDSNTVNPSNFYMMKGGATVSGSLATVGATVYFTPSSALPPNSLLTVYYKSGLLSTGGISLTPDGSFSFRTVGTMSIASMNPSNGTTGILANSSISFTVSNPINAATVNSSSFSVSQGGSSISGSISIAGNTATFTPSSSLAPFTTYSVVISTGVEDITGNDLASNYSFNFTTYLPFNVTGVSPTNGATIQVVNSNVIATFDNPVNPSTVNATNFSVTIAGNPVAGSLSVSGNTITFTPTAPFTFSSTITVSLSTGLQNLTGIGLPSNYSFSFSAIGAPTIVSFNPVTGTIGLKPNQATTLSITFSRAMDPSTITISNIRIYIGSTGQYESGLSISTADNITFTIVKSGEWRMGYHWISISSNAKDSFGNNLQGGGIASGYWFDVGCPIGYTRSGDYACWSPVKMTLPLNSTPYTNPCNSWEYLPSYFSNDFQNYYYSVGLMSPAGCYYANGNYKFKFSNGFLEYISYAQDSSNYANNWCSPLTNILVRCICTWCNSSGY